MAYQIKIPKLGMSMKEATLVEWKYAEGDWVDKDRIVLVIESEKTAWEVEALDSGFLHIVVPADPDGKVAVGAMVGQLAETEEELKVLQEESGIVTTAVPGDRTREAGPAPGPAERPAAGERILASPVAKKMALEKNIDLAGISGTGPGGRITKEDVLTALEKKSAGVPEPPATPAAGREEDIDGKRVRGTISLKSGMRKAIARHMQQSLAISAQLTTMGEIDMSEVKKWRAELLKQEERLGTRITYTDIMVMAVAKALQDHPIINSSIVGDEIKLWQDINIGVAVALEAGGALGPGGGLIVPVLRHADQKKLTEISRDLKVLVKKAREGKILPDDVSGGTFTITNLGGAGGSYGFGTPIINQPESAILGTGPITDRPVVCNNEIVIRPVMTYSFTFDHRVIDGAPAALFMAQLIAVLENPLLILC